ncbi:hexose phosphate transporter [Mycoplasma sp. OR1901]|uniref:hexose phosphate transporter n=1 Tax=Mycoplasma sp. OR1901 TaxID=2742195 RepID=UPI00158360A8|nr:hexose phosphate transporter [Mycoplasma sp. OR1901]QKT05258.1 MFS transporter [Mycoplasma sp. OR1901]
MIDKAVNFLKFYSEKHKVGYGIFLWFFIIFAYLIFITNWGFAGALNGQGYVEGGDNFGILAHFKIVKDKSFDFMTQATNWGVTLGRGIGSVVVALLLVKLFHKKTTIVAISLTLFGIPAQYLPHSSGYYALFLIMRTLMAIGGTMTIILTQPVIASFFNKKQKSVLSSFGILTYPLGTIIAILPFVTTNIEGAKAIVRNWQLILTILSSLNLIPLVVMIIFGLKFDVPKKTEITYAKKEENGFRILWKYLKTKETYSWVLLFGGWLSASVFPVIFTTKMFQDISGVTGFTKTLKIWVIIYLSAVFIGPITVGAYSKYNIKRKWYIALLLTLGILFYVLSLVIFKTSVTNEHTAGYIFFYLFGFISGLLLWGIQGVILNLPHEYKNNNVRKMCWMFSLIWGLGYIIFTLFTIIISLIPIIGNSLGYNNTLVYAIIGFVVIILVSLTSIIGIFMLKEPSEDAQTLPNWCVRLIQTFNNKEEKQK